MDALHTIDTALGWSLVACMVGFFLSAFYDDESLAQALTAGLVIGLAVELVINFLMHEWLSVLIIVYLLYVWIKVYVRWWA